MEGKHRPTADKVGGYTQRGLLHLNLIPYSYFSTSCEVNNNSSLTKVRHSVSDQDYIRWTNVIKVLNPVAQFAWQGQRVAKFRALNFTVVQTTAEGDGEGREEPKFVQVSFMDDPWSLDMLPFRSVFLPVYSTDVFEIGIICQKNAIQNIVLNQSAFVLLIFTSRLSFTLQV